MQGTIGDEEIYLPQIRGFLHGDWSVSNKLAVSPAYHHVIAFIARLLGIDSVDALRLISLLLSLPAVALFYAAAHKLHPDTAIFRAYQFLFLPILLPYCFVLYMEPMALAFLLLAVWLALSRYYTLSGLAGLLSAVVRQNFIVWMGFLFLWIYLREEGLKLSGQALKRHLLRCWIFLIGVVALVLFVLLAGGLSMGETKSIHPLGLYLGNIWFALLLGWLLLLPLHLANGRRIIQFFRHGNSVGLLAGLGLLLGCYLLTFHNDHPNNLDFPEYLHNQLLELVFRNLLLKAAFFLPIAWTVLSLLATPLRERTGWLLYPFWVLSLLPVWMIEQRYALPGFVLFLLLRESAGPRLEAGLAGYFALGSAVLIGGISRGWFFL